MKKIGWIQISSKRYGGVIWNHQAMEVLSKNFDLELVDREVKNYGNKYLKFFISFLNLFNLKGSKDLWIRDFYSTVTMSFDKTEGKSLAVIPHIDFSGFPIFSRLPLTLLEKLFLYRNLKKTDAIVVVSDYWQNYLEKKGCKNIYKIYCGFNLDEFNISEAEVKLFKEKYNLADKPIVYLGNCQKAKGVVDSYNALKNLDAYLVTSGKREVNIPSLNLNLSRREYLILLKASTIVLTMSKFKEGWCMTAHEAMLCKTPVIGSATGGMKELLDGGKQIVCSDFTGLRKNVEILLADSARRKEMGESGYNFAKDFTKERFSSAWLELTQKII